MRELFGVNKPYYTRKDGNKLYRLSPHTLRHYAIWRYHLASGKNLKYASEMIGHQNVEQTAKYINAMEILNNEKTVIENAFSNIIEKKPEAKNKSIQELIEALKRMQELGIEKTEI